MASRQIHKLTQIQVDKARPHEAKLNLRPGAVRTWQKTAQEHPKFLSHTAKLVEGAIPAVRDGKEVTIKRKTRWMSDGNCLWVKVVPSISPNDPDGCSKSFVFRYSLPERVTSRSGIVRQRQRQHGIGSCNVLTLAEAREVARELRKNLLLNGTDPIVAKRGKAASAKVAELRLKTWDTVVDEFLLANGDRWSKVHRRNWIQSLRDHVSSVIGAVPIHDVDTPAALRALTPLHDKHKVTCARVMNRCADVYSFAVLHGYALDPNPFRYKGHLEFRLPQKTEVEHLPALDFQRLPAFMASLRVVDGWRPGPPSGPS
jgi:Phage integrase central domain/Arm DNA-binding domain